jgi:APA family basic amino acid/polyamine antiporter
MVLTGPRVLARIGEDLPTLRFLSARNRRGAPTRAVLLQQGLALVFIVTGSFEGVLTFAGFTLTLFALLTVAGVLRLRQLEPGLPRPFKVPFYPLPPLVFLVASGLSLLFVAGERPYALLAVSALLLAGWVLVRRSPAG